MANIIKPNIEIEKIILHAIIDSDGCIPIRQVRIDLINHPSLFYEQEITQTIQSMITKSYIGSVDIKGVRYLRLVRNVDNG